MNKTPGVSVDILVIRNDKILLGLMTEQWNYEGRQVYGVPGREIRFGEKIGETIKRNIKEEFGCDITSYKIISVKDGIPITFSRRPKTLFYSAVTST